MCICCRAEYEKLEEKHRISETERRKQELIYKHELESRMMRIESQKDELDKLQEQFEHVENVMEREICEVKEKIYEEKRAKIEQLDNEVRRLLLLQTESTIARKAREEEMLALQMIWKKETGRLSEEKEILGALENDLSLLDKDIEEVRHWMDEICHSPKPTTLN
jgi:translation elongation factor EF-1beta